MITEQHKDMATIENRFRLQQFSKMGPPHSTNGTSGQYNDEYDDNAHQKMQSGRVINHHVQWNSTPIIQNLPSSIDDEFLDDGIVTTVDVSMIRNASANALSALVSKENDFEVEVTVDNCLRPLSCVAQEYAWGKIGSDGLVARMKEAQSSDFRIDNAKPYAELWIGTHPNGMSNIVLPPDEITMTDDDCKLNIMPLIDYVQMNPELHLGVEGQTESSDDYDLTFLFKVLSINKVLSIQAHPDKLLAAQLHTDNPSAYKDPNHKPEMAVALTDDFEAMSGFRPIAEIGKNLREYPEFSDLIGLEARDHLLEAANSHYEHHQKKILKHLFRSYMEANEQVLQSQLHKLISRLSKKSDLLELDKLILKLADQFPGDSGIFAPLLFNHLKLKKGEAFYIGANEPHAYIQGDILECMACSDNVVRAGLTPKLKDVETLVKMLTYECCVPKISCGKQVDSNKTLYVPPVEDFAIEIVEVPAGSRYVLNDVRSPSVLLTLGGSGSLQQGSIQSLPVSFGESAFMSANTTATIIANENGPNLKIVRALSNVHLQN